MFNKIETIIRNRYGDGLVPLHEPVIGDLEKAYTMDCLDSTFVSSIGKYVDEFEERIAKYTGAAYAVATTNGTSALSMGLILSGVARDMEVITQNLTFAATANAIIHIGAKPIFIDSSDDNMGLCPAALRSFLEENVELDAKNCPINKKTKAQVGAVVPMHVFGHPVKIKEIILVCKEYNIPVMEDAAEALGSFLDGKHLGTFAPLGILSFNGNKTITTGGGGMILCRDEKTARYAKHITTTAKKSHPYRFFHDCVGYNYRMPNINAALGCAQLDQLDFFLSSKNETSNYYHNAFAELGIETVKAVEGSKSNYWLNAIKIEDSMGLIEYLNEKKILARPIWDLMSDLPYLKECQVHGLEHAKKYRELIVSIPSGAIK